MISLFLLSFFLLSARSAEFSGELVTEDKWHYLGKFCFSNRFQDIKHHAIGHVLHNITTPSSTMQLVLYLDTDDTGPGKGNWDEAYALSKKSDTKCKELVDLGRAVVPVHNGEQGKINTEINTRPYYWFVAVADCTHPKGLELDHYSLQFINSYPLNASTITQNWYKPFSFDQQGLGQAYIFFFVVFLAIISAHGYGVLTLVKRNAYHPLVKLISVVTGILFFSVFLFMCHYASFASNGVGAPGAEGLALILWLGSQLLFMFLCVLIAKGWTITTNHLDQSLAMKIAVALMAALYLSLFIWVFVGRDPASTMYFWDNGIGYTITLLRVALLGWFLWSLRLTFSIEENPIKRQFYLIFGALSTAWFIIPPFLVLIALGVPVWFRYRVITGISLTLDVIGIITLVGLFWPTWIENYFTVTPVSLQSTIVTKEGHDGAQTTYESL